MRTCPKCHQPADQEDSLYCFYCGTYLLNHCTNKFCDLNNGCEIEITPEARYCDLCGSPSTFNEAGFFSNDTEE